MLTRLPGWGDEDVLALLALFRKHLRHYVYASDSEFVDVVHAELPDKLGKEIQEMVKALMSQFEVALSTKNFRGEVITSAGNQVFLHEHIYESISELPENKAGGGVWPPDVLSRFFQKATQHKQLFFTNKDVYFQRIQIWGKSVADMRNKFYLIRDMFMKDKRRVYQRSGITARRYKVLENLFQDVPPLSREKKKTRAVAISGPKGSSIWTSEDLATLVDLIVRITQDIQTTGSSGLVKTVATTLRRTEQSCMNKLSDLKSKFLKKSPTAGFASLPSVIYDPTSDAYKIFNADWNDSNDPYSLGYLAIRSQCLKDLAARNKKRRSKRMELGIRPPRSKRRLSATVRGIAQTRPRSDENSAPPNSISPVQHSTSTLELANALFANEYTTFVHEMGEHCQWTGKVVHNVLRCMQHSIDLYRSNKLVAFFKKIESLCPDVTFQDLFANANHILSQFEKRFGTLIGFENLPLTAMPIVKPASESNVNREDGRISLGEDNVENGQLAHNRFNGADVVKEVFNNANKLGIQQTENTREEDAGENAKPEETGIRQKDRENADVNADEFNHSARVEQDEQMNTDRVYLNAASTREVQPKQAKDADGNADAEDIDEDSRSVASSNAWSGSSNASGGNGNHLEKETAKEPSKGGKDEQYGKKFELAKKRCLEKKTTSDDEDDDDDIYDAGDDEDDPSDDGDESVGDINSSSSDSEHAESPHPLQRILNSLDVHVAELEKKRRDLIEQKEDREWRQRGWDHRRWHQEYSFQMSTPSVSED